MTHQLIRHTLLYWCLNTLTCASADRGELHIPGFKRGRPVGNSRSISGEDDKYEDQEFDRATDYVPVVDANEEEDTAPKEDDDDVMPLGPPLPPEVYLPAKGYVVEQDSAVQIPAGGDDPTKAIQALLAEDQRLRAENAELRNEIRERDDDFAQVRVDSRVSGTRGSLRRGRRAGLLEVGHEVAGSARRSFERSSALRQRQRSRYGHRGLGSRLRQKRQRSEAYATSLQSAERLRDAAQRISHNVDEVPNVAKQSMADSEKYRDILQKVDRAVRNLDRGASNYRRSAAESLRIDGDIERALQNPVPSSPLSDGALASSAPRWREA